VVPDLELTAAKTDELMDARRHIGYSFQNAALFDSMDVRENWNSRCGRCSASGTRRDAPARLPDLDWIGLPGIETSIRANFGGMRKRGRRRPGADAGTGSLLFDEPTTGLDPVLAETINNWWCGKPGVGSLACSSPTTYPPPPHLGQDCFFDRGIIIADGAPKDVSVNNHELVRDFLRTSFNQLEA
jgi:phospholipid/cholesterol/gamma-HCH transport system ATP-binding protein